MRIAAQCKCGKIMQVDTRFAGMSRKCVFCGAAYTVPDMDKAALSGVILDGEKNDVVESMFERADSRPQWQNRYLWIILAMVPLLLTTFSRDDMKIHEKLAEAKQSMTEKDKQELERFENGKVERSFSSQHEMQEEILQLLPDHRLPGALLTYDSWAHWLFAFLSAGLFMGLAVTLFPSRTTEPKHLLTVGVFTGTIGIAMLLLFQWIAFANYPVRSGIIFILVLFTKIIAFSYMAAMDPRFGFIPSLLGFTFGVGLCEELCKMLPIFYHFKFTARLDWRGACAWGLVSGVGFGVSEGITYSSDFYNGMMAADIYYVRFISCVALHAVWAASAGISMWKKQGTIQGDRSIWSLFVNLVTILIVPMVLHGLYDTLLKKDFQFAAGMTALLSVGWLAWTIENAKKHELHLDTLTA